MKVGLLVVGALLAAICVVVIVITSYHIDRDINGWKTRAQVSSEPNDMHEYMSNVKAGMEQWEMTNGYAALIFTKPDNDMSLIYRAVTQHVEQSKVLTAMNRSTPEYQTGLDNLRGSIRELELQTTYYWSVHQGLLFWIGFVFGLIGAVLSLIWLCISSTRW